MANQWWKGMAFSIGARAAQQQLEDDLEEATQFIEEVDHKGLVTTSHTELKDRLETVLDEDTEGQLASSELSTIGRFLDVYKGLFDDRTLNEYFEDAIIDKCSMFPNDSKEEERYYPEKFNKKLPKGGGWIMVKMIPCVADESKPELFGVYFAKPAPVKIPFVVGVMGRSYTRNYDYYKVKISTEGGELHLWPHEYVLISNIDMVLEGVGTEFTMVKLGGDTNYDSSKVHYLGTRGISQSEVYQMLMGAVNTTNFAYFKLASQEYIDYYQFSFDCFARGISGWMIERLWHAKQTGEPLFNIKYVKKDKNGKEVQVDKAEFERSKNQKEVNSEEDQPTG